MRLVDDQQIDPRLDRLPGQFGPINQRLQPQHHAPVRVERVEARTVVLLHVDEPFLVEQHEHLVVLAPEFAEPLDRQRLGCDHQRPVGPSRAKQVIQNQAGLDRFSQADLISEQPAHQRRARRRLGRVELVREQTDAAAEKRTQAVGLANRREVQRVEPERKPLEAVDLAVRHFVEQRDTGMHRPEVFLGDLATVGQTHTARRGQRDDRHRFVAGLQRDARADRQRQRDQRVGGLGQAQGVACRELNHQRAALGQAHHPGSQLGVEAMHDAVSRLPRHAADHSASAQKGPI